MSDERDYWEQDDYSESWDSDPNQAMAYMMALSGPDDDEIEAEAERSNLEENSFSCEECNCNEHTSGSDCCECYCLEDSSMDSLTGEAGGQIYFHASLETRTEATEIFERFVLVPRWSDDQVEELRVCAGLGMSVQRIATRMGIDQSAIILHLAAERLISLEALNEAVFKGVRSSTGKLESDWRLEEQEGQELLTEENNPRSRNVEDSGHQF